MAIQDGFYVIDDGVTRPMHRLALKVGDLLNLRLDQFELRPERKQSHRMSESYTLTFGGPDKPPLN